MKLAHKDLFKNLFLLFASVFLTLVLAEIGLRLALPGPSPVEGEKEKTNWAIVPERVWTEYHPVFGWYHKKNARAVLKSPHFADIPVTTNSEGFRGEAEYVREKPEGVRRGIFLGDSFVFGFGVNAAEAFPAVVAREMDNFESLNMGVPGYGIDQIYLAYKEIGADYETDYVFIGIFPEDFWRATRRFADSGHAKPYFILQPDGESLSLKNVPVPEPFSLKKEQFPEIIQPSGLDRWLSGSRVYGLVKKGLTRLSKELNLIDADTTQEWLLGKAILKQLIRDIRARGDVPVILVLPSEGWAKSERETSLRKSINRLAGQLNADIIDMTPEFHKAISNASLTDYYIKGDWHWTEKGHSLAARLITGFLTNKESARMRTDVRE